MYKTNFYGFVIIGKIRENHLFKKQKRFKKKLN